MASTLLAPEAMPIPGALVQRRGRLRRVWPVPLALVYAAIGIYCGSLGLVDGDSLARVVNSELIINGRDPHFAAVGFVWGPLISIIELPFVALHGIIPGMVANNYAGVCTSAIFAAWLVYHVYCFAREQGVSRGWKLLVAIGIAANPMILIYSVDGMSEVPFMCTLVGAARYVVRWERRGLSSDLALAGCWLAAGYLIRYETAAAVAGTLVFIGVVSFLRGRSVPGRSPWLHSLVDCLVFSLPVAFSVATFAGMSWWFTGQVLGEYSQEYGNPAFLVTLKASAYPASQLGSIISTDIIALEPFLPAVIPICVGIALRRRSGMFPALLAVLGSVAAFEIYSVATASILSWLRFFIVVIPFTTLSLLLLAPFRWIGATFASLVIAASCIGSWAITGNPHYANGELPFRLLAAGEPAYVATTNQTVQIAAARAVASWIDEHAQQANSAALGDQAGNFTVLAESRDPDDYVIPSTSGFETLLEAPYQNGVRYVISIPPVNGGTLDIVNRYYPGLWEGCEKNTQLVLVVGQNGDPSYWRIYQLTGPITPGAAGDTQQCLSPQPLASS